MPICEVCGNDYLRCNCESQQPFCEQCSESTDCNMELDSGCVVYHPLPTTEPSKLENLNMPNGSSAEAIFEAIDDFLGNSANVPITPVASPSATITATGTAAHTLKVDVKVSPDTLNQLETRSNGLYAKAYNENYFVKVDPTDTPDYLQEQIVGGSDGIVSVSVENENGLLVVLPTLNVQALLDKIRDQYGDAFCELVSNCISYSWVMDTYECESSDLDLVTSKTINNLPEPQYAFEDNGRVYFLSANNTTGSVWSLDPVTATSVSDIVYLNETRSGQPYGASGGTYTAGVPYRADARSGGSGSTLVNGFFFDKSSRTLYIHSFHSYGCDYYDFSTATWGKVGVGSTGSAYNTTLSTDMYTHIPMHSNDDSNLIITAWGSNSGTRGRMVIVIDKANKVLLSELNATGSPTFAGITGNPFNNSWGGFLAADGRIFVGRNNVSDYRNIAVFNSSLTPILEILPVNSNTGFNGSSSYWQSCFIDPAYNKFYLNDYMSRKMEVYDTTTYALLKTFSFDNNRTYSTCLATFNINGVTNELFIDLTYGGNSASSSDDAPINQMVSYKVDRSTLDILKTYIGTPKASNLVPLTNGDIVTSILGDLNPSAPTTVGQAIFYQKNTSSLKNGTVDVLTLKQVNDNTMVPTGQTKPNSPSDPDYIAPYLDTTLCPVSYTLAAPSNIILTASATGPRYSIDFGLNDDVVMNPVLASIVATIRNSTTSSTLGTKTWTIPNGTSPNAFFDAQILAGISAGNTIVVDLVYRNASNVAIATYNNAVSVTATA
jgi:hypothetical protein